ncbi:hypothetical protein A0H81_00186 [Grifola frondosa]|uniref:Peptidase A1 domain-containing protein n=1 Tax=Grifola frondosa TaxID=5627 RepID=A0A1C7MUD9_GRIFR|nr:hypothetical protein A0H81_00186 [Grifola frondosa]
MDAWQQLFAKHIGNYISTPAQIDTRHHRPMPERVWKCSSNLHETEVRPPVTSIYEPIQSLLSLRDADALFRPRPSFFLYPPTISSNNSGIMRTFGRTRLLLALCSVHLFPLVYAFTPPARLDIPLHFDSLGRYVLPIAMGDNTQHFNFTMSMSTGLTFVAGNNCSTCNDTNLYNESASPTAQSLSGQEGVNVLGGSFNGSAFKEDCAMTTLNGSSWDYPNQTILVTNNQGAGSIFGDGISGLVGLGTNKNLPASNYSYSAGFDDTIFGAWLIQHPDAPYFSYGMQIRPPAQIPSTSSSLSLASDPDSSAYVNDELIWLSTQDNVTSGFLSNSDQPDWTVELDGWSAKIGSDTVGNMAAMVTSVDPYYPDIYLPFSQAQLIHDAIAGAVSQDSLSTIPGRSQAWTVPCNTKISFTVAIGTQSFTTDQSVLIVAQSDGTCVSVIEGWTDTFASQYLLGARFMSQIYMIFNVPRDGASQIGFAPLAQSKSKDIGAIVGGTVGGVAGVLGLGLLAFYLIRRRQDNVFFRRAAVFEEEAKVASTVVPYVEQAPPTPAQVSQFGTPPVTPSTSLFAQSEPGPIIPPPSYQEASESGASPPVSPRDAKTRHLHQSSVSSQPTNRTSEISGVSGSRFVSFVSNVSVIALYIRLIIYC